MWRAEGRSGGAPADNQWIDVIDVLDGSPVNNNLNSEVTASHLSLGVQ